MASRGNSRPRTSAAAEKIPLSPDDTLGHAIAECLARLAAGHAEARDQIIELVGDRLRSLAHRMLARFPAVRRWEETDDLFQNAALRLHRSLGQMTLTDPRSVLAVAATELNRALLDLARKHSGPMSDAANHLTNSFVPSADGTADAMLAHHVDQAEWHEEPLDRWSAFQEAIESLEPTSREVFQMVWYLGCDQKTIAATLGISERTVKTRWREAREAIRARLDGISPA